MSASVHWLELTVFASALEASAFYDLWLADDFGQAWEVKAGFPYKRRLCGASGVSVACVPVGGPREHFHVVLPGQACESVSLEWFTSLRVYLDNLGVDWRCTRLDLATDDYPFTPRRLASMYHAGMVESPLKKWSFIMSGGGVQEGETFSLGARGGDCFVRVYDARGFNRLELELRRELADNNFRILCGGDFFGGVGDLAVFRAAFSRRVRALAAVFVRVLARNKRSTHTVIKVWLNNACASFSQVMRSARRATVEGLERHVYNNARALAGWLDSLGSGAELHLLHLVSVGRAKLRERPYMLFKLGNSPGEAFSLECGY